MKRIQSTIHSICKFFANKFSTLLFNKLNRFLKFSISKIPILFSFFKLFHFQKLFLFLKSLEFSRFPKPFLFLRSFCYSKLSLCLKLFHFHFLKPFQFLKTFFFLPLFILFIQCLFIQFLSEPQALSHPELETTTSSNLNLIQQKRPDWYNTDIQTNYLFQQYAKNPALYAQHKFTLNGDKESLNTINQFLEGNLTAPETRRRLAGSITFLGITGRGSVSDSSFSVGGEVDLGVAEFSLDLEIEPVTTEQQQTYQRELFLQSIRNSIYANPEEVHLQARTVVKNQTKYHEFISFRHPLGGYEDVPPIDAYGNFRYSLDGGESFQNLSRKEIETAVDLNQISKNHNIFHINFENTNRISNQETLTQNIERNHPELKLPYQIANLQGLTDKIVQDIQAGNSTLEDYLQRTNSSTQKLREDMTEALRINVETNIRNIADDIVNGRIDINDVNASDEVMESIYFRVETNIQAMYSSSSDKRRKLENNRNTNATSIAKAKEKIAEAHQNISIQEALLAEDPSSDRTLLIQETQNLNKQTKRLQELEETSSNIETKILKFDIAYSKMAVQSVTSVLSLVGFKEAKTMNAFMQSSLTSTQAIGDIVTNGLKFSNVLTLTEGISGLMNLISNTPSIEEQMMKKMDEIISNQVAMMKAIDEVHQIVSRTEQKVDMLNTKMDHLIDMTTNIYNALNSRIINVENLIFQMNREMKQDFLAIRELYVASEQDSALKRIFEDIASIHDLFNDALTDPIRIELIGCKTKQDPENECTQTARNKISKIRDILSDIVFHIEKTILQDSVFLSTVNFFDLSEVEASSYLQDEEEMKHIFGAEKTHFNTSVEGKTGMLYSLGNWLNNHVGDQGHPLPLSIPSEPDETSETDETNESDNETSETHEMRRLVNTNNLRDIPNPRILHTLFSQFIQLAMYLPQYPNNKINKINKICTLAVQTNKATSELRKSIDLAWDVYRFHLEQYKEFFTQQIERAKNNFASALSNKISRDFLFSSDASIRSYVNNLSDSSLRNISLSIPGTYESRRRTTRDCERRESRCYHPPGSIYSAPSHPKLFSDTGKLLLVHDTRACYRGDCFGGHEHTCDWVCSEWGPKYKVTDYFPKKHLLINKIISVKNSHLNTLKTHFLGTHSSTRSTLDEKAKEFALARLALETTIRGGFGDENINYHFESLQNLRRTIVRSPSHYFDRDSRLNSVVIARESDINQNLNSFREWMKRVEEGKLMRWVEEGEVHFDVIPERLPIPSTDELKIAIQNAQRLLGFGNPTGIRDLLNEASGQDDLEPNENCVTAFNNSLVL